MTDSARALRRIPLMPPSRPKKSPSPRLTPRRSSCISTHRSLSGPSVTLFSGGRENNENGTNDNQTKADFVSLPSENNLAHSSIQKTPRTDDSSSLITNTPEFAEPEIKDHKNDQHDDAEEEERETSYTTSTSNLPHSPTHASSSKASSAKSPSNTSLASQSFDAGTHEADVEAPLTPRTLVMEAGAVSTHITMTPPLSSPTPLVVSAKHLGNKVKRRTSATKRRRPENDEDSTTSSSDEDDDTMKIPEGLSPRKAAEEYWKRCYGSLQPQKQLQQTSWSAKRAAPAKGCLSHSKPTGQKARANILMPPQSALLHSPPPAGSLVGPTIFSTPKSSPIDCQQQKQHKCSHSKSVQFGTAQAAEFDLDAPSSDKFTPLPPDFVKARFPLTNKLEENQEEQEEIEETKENSAMLAEWEEDFDSFLNEKPKNRSNRRSNKKHKKRSRPDCPDRSARRRSTNFSSPTNHQALYDPASDMDSTTSTPEERSPSVLNSNMACLTMASPSLSAGPGKNVSMESDTSVSPVVARRLSTEAGSTETTENPASDDQMKIITQEEEDEPPLPPPARNIETNENGLKCHTKLPPGTMNIWNGGVDVLKRDIMWDPVTVFSNLAMRPISPILNTVGDAEDSEDEKFEESVASWNICLQSSVGNALGILSEQLSCQDSAKSPEHNSRISRDQEDHLEWLAEYEWKKLELEFYKTLQLQINQAEEQVGEKALVLDSVVVPAQASLRPTQQEIEATNEAIQILEAAIVEEKRRKQQWQQRRDDAILKRFSVHAPLAMLLYNAMCLLSPIEVAVNHHHDQSQAIFNHYLLEGLETRLELTGPRDAAVVQTCRADKKTEDIVGRDQLSQFYSSMLCSGDDTPKLQEGLRSLLPAEGDITEYIAQLSILLGRIDLAATSFWQLRNEYDVSMQALIEDGEPVVVAAIKLRPNLTVKASYGRNNAESLYWSTPNIAVELDGAPRTDLLGTLNQMTTSWRSLERTAGLLRAACEIVLQNIENKETLSCAK